MIPAGEFLPRPQPGVRIAARLGIGATLVAIIASFAAVAALLLRLVSVLLPVALVAGLVAYTAFRIHVGIRTRGSPGAFIRGA